MTPPIVYDVGDSPVLTGSFTDRDTGLAANPTSVIAKVRSPAGVVTTYDSMSTPAVTNPAVGTFELIHPPFGSTAVGDWYYRFEGVGSVIAAAETLFTVRPSAFATSTPPTNQWVSGVSLLSDPRLDASEMPPEVSLDACAMSATEYLFKRTGRRFRTFSFTIRPNRLSVCGCSITDCWSSTELSLDGPVAPESLVVVVDGVTLAESAYTLYDGYLLVREDGGYWPNCQHLSVPDGQEGTFSISGTRGEAPGMDGILACRELAIHVALALSGKPSKIPARATGVQRRGLSLNLLRGLKSTGIPLVDDYIASSNPHGLMGRPSVMSPDSIRLSGS